MRIAIEALGIHYFGGGRTATLNLLEALFEIDTQNEYVVVLSQPEPSLMTPAGNVHQWVVPMKNRLALRIWAQAVLPFKMRDFDLVHFVKNLSVFGLSAPTIVTVYDLTTLIHPDLFPALDVFYWRHVEKQTLRRANRIIAISHNTARDIVRYYQIPSERIKVIYPACAPHFKPVDETEIVRVRKKYNLPAEFVLHVGRIDLKKNLSTLVEAFALFREGSAFENKLVFVGEEYRKSKDRSLAPTIERLGLREHVLFTGPVPDSDIAALYGAASVAVFPSLHEGFGLVALEAMACGTPLIVSSAGAVSEVVGDAAVILEAVEATSLAEALTRIVQDQELRQRMRKRELLRARSFCRKDLACQTLKLYEKVAAKSKHPVE